MKIYYSFDDYAKDNPEGESYRAYWGDNVALMLPSLDNWGVFPGGYFLVGLIHRPERKKEITRWGKRGPKTNTEFRPEEWWVRVYRPDDCDITRIFGDEKSAREELYNLCLLSPFYFSDLELFEYK